MQENITNVSIVDDKRSGLATASLVLGIIAIVGSWIPLLNVFSIILAVVGLILGVVALIQVISKKKGSMSKTIAGLVLCVLTILIATSINAAAVEAVDDAVDDMDGTNTESILENEIEVNIGEYTTDGNEYYEMGELKVTVKNLTDETKTYTLDLEALNSDGTRIDTDTIYVTNLASGQRAVYEAFTLSDTDELKSGVTFNVYEVSGY